MQQHSQFKHTLSLEERSAQEALHVEEGRRIVEEQRKRIADKRGGSYGLELLRTFERSLEIFEADLDRLVFNILRRKG